MEEENNTIKINLPYIKNIALVAKDFQFPVSLKA